VVDHQVGGDDRVDPGGITAEAGHRRAQRSQVDHAGHAGEILQNDPRRAIGYLLLAGVFPGGKVGDIVPSDRKAIELAKGGFEQNADRVRQPGEAPKPLRLDPVQPVDHNRAVCCL